MAQIELLVQAFGTENHVSALKKTLSLRSLTGFVATVAFVREEGVDAIADELKKRARDCVFLVGIRNEITSIQAVRRLMELGVKLFAVDTASRAVLFHPKMFLGRNRKKAIVVIGSANVTFSGLHNNIEASAIIHLDLSDAGDAKFLEEALKSIADLPRRFPDHVFRIKTLAEANKLFEEGRLTDESVNVATPPRSSIRKGERDLLKPIPLPLHSPPKRVGRIRKHPKDHVADPAGPASTIAMSIPSGRSGEFVMVWQSKALTERDLNIPTGSRTNATGSMLWKKGAAEDIDQRHFFRDEVFAGLRWNRDSRKTHYERSEADFILVVKGLNYGVSRLKLSHNTSVTSATYLQNNAMTSVSWGPVAEIIGKPDLLGRTMSLYRDGTTPPRFLIEID